MSENTTHTENVETPAVEVDYDFDSWLAGASRPARIVPLYADGNLLADLDRAKHALTLLGDPDPKNESMSGDADRQALTAEVDRLRSALDKTRIEVRVEATLDDEWDALQKAVRKETADARKAAEDEAREEATVMGSALKLPAKEGHEYVRGRVAAASDAVVNRELVLQLLSDCVQVKRAGRWEPIGREALVKLQDRVGDAQMLALQEAWQAARSERPEETSAPFSHGD